MLLNRSSSAIAACAWALGGCGSDPGCGNHLLQRVLSADGRRQAVVYARDCGATTDVSTQVSVLPSGRTVFGRGNVFVVDGGHRREVAGPGGGPRVWVHWLDARTLEVRYDPRARIVTQDRRHDDTNIRFVPDRTGGPGA